MVLSAALFWFLSLIIYKAAHLLNYKLCVDESEGTSSRDDLLREIALMKNLGSHPNIVSMIGACTEYELIALLMEYMPYGNLQTFLK